VNFQKKSNKIKTPNAWNIFDISCFVRDKMLTVNNRSQQINNMTENQFFANRTAAGQLS